MKTFLLLLLLALPILPTAADSCTAADAPGHEPAALPTLTSDAAPRHIILMIGDGMGAEHVWAAWMVNRGRLNITQLPVIGFSRTPSASHAITDSAAGATAPACGVKAVNGHIAQDSEGRAAESILLRAQRAGLSTGLIATKDITDATPACFYAHADDRRQKALIAAQLPESGIDFVRGGGSKHFREEQLQEMRARGMDIELLSDGDMPPAGQRGDVLPKATREALERLSRNPQGFFLMIEGSQIDVAAHRNDLAETVREVLDFDRAVGEVLRWMQQHPDTLLLVTADHQTGGLSILGGSVQEGRVDARFSTGSHSGVAVPLYAAGAGAARFGGIWDNTELHGLLRKALPMPAAQE